VVGCIFLCIVLFVFGVAILLIPLGTALSFGQGFVVTALLGAAAWTAWAAWRDGGALALVLDTGGEEHCFPALPEDEKGVVLLEFELDDGLRVVRAPEDREGFGGSTYTDLTVEPGGRPRLELRRARPGARRGRLTLVRGTTTLWEVPDVRVGRPVVLSEIALRVLRLEGPATLVFLDR